VEKYQLKTTIPLKEKDVRSYTRITTSQWESHWETDAPTFINVNVLVKCKDA